MSVGLEAAAVCATAASCITCGALRCHAGGHVLLRRSTGNNDPRSPSMSLFVGLKQKANILFIHLQSAGLLGRRRSEGGASSVKSEGVSCVASVLKEPRASLCCATPEMFTAGLSIYTSARCWNVRTLYISCTAKVNNSHCAAKAHSGRLQAGGRLLTG